MTGGDGNESYTKNSLYQGAVINSAKPLVQKSIAEHIDQLIISSPTLETFCIADLGCSVGPNTFFAISNILEPIKLKYPNSEFQVHFSDHTLNDFNTLFKSLPPNRDYYASGVPGSFYTRLFPRASLHVAHCSTALHWLSQVPREITDRTSRAYNKGKIHNVGHNEEVTNAYLRQFATDLVKFLDARAQELVPGGLVMLILPARPDGAPHSQIVLSVMMDMIGDCLMDLAREVEEFNVPMHFASPQELEQVIKQHGRFSIERMENVPQVQASDIFTSPEQLSLAIRASTEELITKHFGREISDRVFPLFPEKFVKGQDRILASSSPSLFVLLKLN
ncbi:probable S-adenosylmethionine-dependent methyltransferase at5g38780 [Phtheirospermum japonicum]|uniref:Probable S-adenosylmethionine-dependent methyltransferase at5g38780 n=1 Tax=Phtheirospermum japonicum TaxID=374723 RepID=A0A830BLD2_9LAMI|nr:probable S-adenosylmethionine-dependent methyltransferase at5g38780 [Phtheirospermum japonicum]